eukprot:TRINITY_DN6684_c0_g1_i2.p1 TRINITY_DN6684_c0_g1~~TRINITY_DN6684_c0_g1_i2.p1  ORF type:complete len:176 (+),score=17.34 TRINITY_DN6684_c0_g1_i2:329-856(+)
MPRRGGRRRVGRRRRRRGGGGGGNTLLGQLYNNYVFCTYGVKCRCKYDDSNADSEVACWPFIGIYLITRGVLAACPRTSRKSKRCCSEVCVRVFFFPWMFIQSLVTVMLGVFLLLSLDVLFFFIAMLVSLFTLSPIVCDKEIHIERDPDYDGQGGDANAPDDTADSNYLLQYSLL